MLASSLPLNTVLKESQPMQLDKKIYLNWKQRRKLSAIVKWQDPEHREAKTIRKKAMRSHISTHWQHTGQQQNRLYMCWQRTIWKKIKKTISLKTKYEQIKNASIKFSQWCQNKFHIENCKNIAKKVKEDLNKWKGIPGSQITLIINSNCYCCSLLTGSCYIAQGGLQLAM